MRKVTILTINNSFYQNLYPWETLDIKVLIDELDAFNIRASVTPLFNEASGFFDRNPEEDEIIISGGTQNKYLKGVLEDYTYWLEKRGYLVYPSYENLRALENKGFQALATKTLLNETLSVDYSVASSTAFSDKHVYKLVDGAGGETVFMPSNAKGMKKTFFKNRILNTKVKDFKPYLLQLIKKNLLFKWRYSTAKEIYLKPYLPIVKQEFIPKLSNDFKILIFGDLYFVLKRNNREDDFRASGSNNFEFVEEPIHPILNLASKVVAKLNTPYASLDIALDENDKAILIEYQTCHFGPYTYYNAKKVFKRIDAIWTTDSFKTKSLEHIYAYGLGTFLSKFSN